MAIIERGSLDIKNLKHGDRLNLSFQVLGYDLTSKKLAMDVKTFGSSTPLLRFSSEATPPTIYSTEVDGTWTITLDQTSLDMRALKPGRYVFDIEVYTVDTDTETIIDGTIEIVTEITKRDK